MSKKQMYIAYGSNINLEQIPRLPTASPIIMPMSIPINKYVTTTPPFQNLRIHHTFPLPNKARRTP